jgi:hypothetical protein
MQPQVFAVLQDRIDGCTIGSILHTQDIKDMENCKNYALFCFTNDTEYNHVLLASYKQCF